LFNWQNVNKNKSDYVNPALIAPYKPLQNWLEASFASFSLPSKEKLYIIAKFIAARFLTTAHA
jgi:hypothetical protein